jgi:hypothetical protein
MITTHDVMKGWFSIYSTVFLNRMGPINFTAFSIPAGTMSDQEFETFREFVILGFLPFLKTPILQKFPDHL